MQVCRRTAKSIGLYTGLDHTFLVVPSQMYIVNFIETFKAFTPRQKPASFGIDQALETLQQTAGGR